MRDRRKHLTLLLVIVAALVGALMLEVPGSPRTGARPSAST